MSLRDGGMWRKILYARAHTHTSPHPADKKPHKHFYRVELAATSAAGASSGLKARPTT